METNRSLLRKAEQLHHAEKETNLYDHMMLVMEVDERGIPNGNMVKIKGQPFTVLGMIDVAIRKLEEIRENIHDKFEAVEAMSKGLRDMPEDIRKKIDDFEKRAREAAQRGDIDALEQIKEEAKNMFKDEINGDQDDEGKSDSDGFNLNDFKGSF